MSRAARYQIVDEPTPSGIANLAVGPVWPLLGLMLGGAWLGWPWFVINAIALGMRARGRTFVWVGAAIAVCAAVPGAALALEHADRLPKVAIPWIGFVLVICKVTVGYALFEQQTRTAELLTYFGGRLRNGLPIVLVALFVARQAVARLLNSIDTDAGTVASFVLL